MTESVRLAKRVADLVPCSRSEAEQYIEGGWILVDGQVTEEPGFRVLPQQLVERIPHATLAPALPVTILLHKPAGMAIQIETQQAPAGIAADNRIPDDRSGIRFLKRHLIDLSMTSVLDASASGLLVFTQDWRIKRKLIDDAAGIEQEFIVEVSGQLAPDGLALLNHGLYFNGRPLAPIKVSWQSETRLRFAGKGVQNGQIAHMCKAAGLTVKTMRRIRIGRVPLAGLPVGQWRYLLGYERF
ncbi:rRNA pseudouridine synthase [Herminiimonas sp. CN]|uniref:rRNA pseudouridine synthase n=1 Tax=Herminiimonas sp. CN TaxID=1349818 RepID=UPI0004740906|nr:rRNA pseudouridine synthase [Herminiimonas sp. CN]